MIELGYEEYCEDCTRFDPEIASKICVKRPSGEDSCNTIIKCKNREKCVKERGIKNGQN